MYSKFFGFKEKPFKLVPNPEYLFLSKSHEEALGHLTYAISHGDGFVEITGEVGTGKTTLCRVFLGNLDSSIEAAYIFNPKLDALQLLKAINDEFGIDSRPDNTKDLIDILNRFLIEKKAAGKKVLVLIDEAQNLSLEVLEQLRLVSNLETTQEKLLQIILVGQPELGDMLSSHQLRQLGQRITINCQLAPLTFQETKDYIRHRISLASHRAGPPFDKASYRTIYDYSKGIPRLINIACDRVLLNAFSRNSFKISGSITREAIKELTRKKAVSSYSWLQGNSGLAIVLAVFIPLIFVLLYLANGESPEISAISEPPPEQVTQLRTKQPTHEDEQVARTELQKKSIAPQKEESLAIQGDIFSPGQPEIASISEQPPEKATQAETKLPTQEDEQIAINFRPQKTSVTPETEEPIAIQETSLSQSQQNEDLISHSVHVGTFQTASLANKRKEEMKSLGYPSFMYTQKNSSGDTLFVVVAGKYQSYDLAKEASQSLSMAGYSNFVSRAKDSLTAGTNITEQQKPNSIVVQQPQKSGESPVFLNYLQGLNSRLSRNNSMEEILRLWLPTTEIKITQNKIDTNRLFFQEAAKEYDLQVQPVASESDIDLIQTLNLPAIFTFYLVGHTWPKYLAVAYIDTEKIYFIGDEQGKTVPVDRDVVLQYWSGEAYVFWKNFSNIKGMITERSNGSNIKSLKKLLRQLGYAHISLSEEYDQNTQKTIQNIQEKYGFHVDGLVGPLTKIVLYNESREFTKPSLVNFKAAKMENGS